DTLQDEKFEAIRVAQALGRDLYAVRLDTPSSRRGDFYRIIEEVRWELGLRGFGHVKILASGGIDEYEILALNPVVDGYGVGTSIANAPVLNFALDIMEIEGRPMAKRGKWSGAKDVFRRRGALETVVLPAGQRPPGPGGAWEPLLKPLVAAGRVVRDLPPPRTLREYVLDQLTRVPLETLRRQGLRQDVRGGGRPRDLGPHRREVLPGEPRPARPDPWGGGGAAAPQGLHDRRVPALGGARGRRRRGAPDHRDPRASPPPGPWGRREGARAGHAGRVPHGSRGGRGARGGRPDHRYQQPRPPHVRDADRDDARAPAADTAGADRRERERLRRRSPGQ